MAAKIDIFNLAITLLGGIPVTSPTQNNRAAIALNTVYDMIRLGELRKKPSWNFSIKLVELAANATAPAFGKAFSYPLPADFIAVARPFSEMDYNDNDFVIQDGELYSNFSAPYQLRYVSDVTDTSKFDPQFTIALAARLASACADAITQSNTKVQTADSAYKTAIADAARANAFDNAPQDMADDPYWTVRL